MEEIRPITSLPNGAWAMILSRLDFRSKVQCERTCRQLHGLLSRPGLWDRIDLTLEQLVGQDNHKLLKDLRSPAARWALKRLTRDTPGRETHIHLTGHASCIAEGFSVPWFFATLDHERIDYSIDVEMTGFPLGYARDEATGRQRWRAQMTDHVQRDIATLWNMHLFSLHLHTPPASFDSSDFFLLRALPALTHFKLSGAVSPSRRQWDTETETGLSGDLSFLKDTDDLESLELLHHQGLTDIRHLKDMSALSHLSLHDTGLRQWPSSMSSQTGLETLSITQPQPPHKEGSPTIFDPAYRTKLVLPRSFFRHQPWLSQLSLAHHSVILDGVQSFKHLKNLRQLDLTGCDLGFVRGRVTQLLMQNGSRPLQGLTTLQHLSLSCFAPFSGGWYGMQNALCALGVTSMGKLASLDLSHSRLEDVPEHLSLLTALTRLNLSNNLLLPDSLCDPAILALSRLRFLSLANCMPTCLMSAVRASTYQQEFYFGDVQRQREPAARREAALASLYQLPNMHRLKRACPRLKELHVCNAA